MRIGISKEIKTLDPAGRGAGLARDGAVGHGTSRRLSQPLKISQKCGLIREGDSLRPKVHVFRSEPKLYV